jgi:hypothetical protein
MLQSMTFWGKVIAALALSLLTNGAAGAAEGSRPPNLVFVLLDNVGQEWFGCYRSQEKATPNIDGLGRQGLRFEHCYAPPVCSPSRVMLLVRRPPGPGRS